MATAALALITKTDEFVDNLKHDPETIMVKSTLKCFGTLLAVAILFLSAGCGDESVATTIDGRAVVAHVSPITMATLDATDDHATITINSTKIHVNTKQVSWSNGTIPLPDNWRSLQMYAHDGGIDVQVDGKLLGRIS